MKHFPFKTVLIITSLSICLPLLAEAEWTGVYLNDRYFKVELSFTPKETTHGLMFRESLPYDEGMLFVFDKEQKWSFHMKNTLIPLDIIWIDKDRKIVSIKKNAEPCLKEPCPVIYPDKEAMYVLELNAGIADEIGLEVGDEAAFK